MRNRVVEVSRDRTMLSVERGFMKISQPDKELGLVPIDDVAAVLIHAHGATISTNLITRLARNGVPICFCDEGHTPTAFILPKDGNHKQGMRMEAQAAATLPTKKRLWKQLVQAKILAQAETLSFFGEGKAALRTLANRVRSGDPDNLEARAARIYWRRLMGREFRRDRSIPGANAKLNYGYMVLRAAVARSIVGAGLHPSLSIHHVSRGDALRLSNDLMEPFRPYVDLQVKRLEMEGKSSLDPDVKLRLVEVLSTDVHGARGATPIQNAIDYLAVSLAMVFTKERKTLELPTGLIQLAAVR